MDALLLQFLFNRKNEEHSQHDSDLTSKLPSESAHFSPLRMQTAYSNCALNLVMYIKAAK